MNQPATPFLTILLFIFLHLTFLSPLSAQVPTANSFLLRVTIDGFSKDYQRGDCGYSTPYDWGGPITHEACGSPVWVHDSSQDSLACDTITENLSGKWALIRRGNCSFSQKAYYAQQAGAEVVIMINHYLTATENGCTVVDMPAFIQANNVHVPVIFVGRDIGESIDNALQAGQEVQLCFLFSSMYGAVAAYHYATPVSQVDTLRHIGVHYLNRSDTAQQNVVLKAVIREPAGNLVTLSKTIDAAAQQDTFVIFPPYLPPSVLGRFDLTFSNDFYSNSRDSLRRSFQHTLYTFATDNLTIEPGGVAPPFIDFDQPLQQSGGLCRTGPNGGVASYATFGLANAEQLSQSDTKYLTVILYDADPNDDGLNDFHLGFVDLNTPSAQVAYYIYNIQDTEALDSLITVPLTPLMGSGPIELKPRHLYYISLVYDGNSDAYPIALSRSREEEYIDFPTTPLFFNQLYHGYPGSTIIERLQLEGYPQNLSSVKPTLLDASQVVVSPNPANDQIHLDIRLKKGSANVDVSLIDWNGRSVKKKTLKNFQTGQTAFEVSALPAGTYLIQIITEEGVLMRKVAIHH